MDTDKRFVGSIYIEHDDSGKRRWRSSHDRRNSWTNLAALEVLSKPSRTASGSSSQPLRLFSVANPKRAAEARALQMSRSAPAGLRPPSAKAPSAPSDVSLKANRRPSKQTVRPPSASKQARPPGAAKQLARPPTAGAREGVDEVAYVCQTAKKLHIPVATAKQAADLFKELGDAGGRGVITDWRMSREQFVKVLCKLADKSRKDLEDELIDTSFFDADVNRRGWLDFDNLAFWLSNNSFSEEVNLDDEQKELRKLARKYNMHIYSVEKYKKDFDEFDADGSGAIDPEEFDNLIHKCAKVPPKLRLPATRVRQFWRDADTDENGEVGFEEFLVFQKKYFGTDGKSGAQRNGFEDYYRGVRKHCWN